MMLLASIFVSQQMMALTFSVTVPAGTNACYITGDVTGGWGTFEKMTRVDATHYTVDLPNATEAGEYKYFSGPGWDYEEAIDAEGTARAANRTWSENSGVDEVLFWKAVFLPNLTTVTIDCLVPLSVHELYITGSFCGWSGNFNNDLKMTFEGNEEGGKVFTYTLTTENPTGLEFKFVAGPDWAFEQTRAANYKLADGNQYETNKYAYNVSEFKSIFDPALAGYITITATVPETAEVWLQGSLFGWGWANPEAMKMTKNTDGTFTFTTPSPVQSFEYRLYNCADWACPEKEYLINNETGLFEWKDKPNRVATYVTSATYSITVCKWANDDGGQLCEQEASAVEQINADYFTVNAATGKIVVTNAKASVELFDITGKRIDSASVQGDYASQTLQCGLY
ncbi:MAG: hypothetical protein LBD45_00865, partial [Bacteroidales bacterium]|nr:hypothetical protein [Bacteroidales bacterium]